MLHWLDKGLKNYQYRFVFVKPLPAEAPPNRALSHVHLLVPSLPASLQCFEPYSKEESFFFNDSTKLVCSSSLLKDHHVFQVIVAAKKYGKAECNSQF